MTDGKAITPARLADIRQLSDGGEAVIPSAVLDLCDEVERLQTEMKRLLDYRDGLYVERDKWRNDLSAAHACIGTLREVFGCEIRNVSDVPMEQHSREIAEGGKRDLAEAVATLRAAQPFIPSSGCADDSMQSLYEMGGRIDAILAKHKGLPDGQ